uniref:Reverse transcriptase domain-containing protein n=1 Tax=Oryzias latipes TaxID=8090 RepID=A0A3B3HDP0_ORYLA
MISQRIDDFIETNQKDDISPSILWETLKAVIRGEIISYSAKIKKMKRTTQEELIKSISKVDAQYSASPSPELYKKRLHLQTKYNLIATEKTEQLLLKSRGYLYEHGDKAGRFLAHQLKCRSAAQLIPQITKKDGTLTIDPAEINEAFTSFYSDLYMSEMTEDCSEMEMFLNNLESPLVTEIHRTNAELPLDHKEITNAIHSMQNGKAPGPDGYPIEFYKKFSNRLSPILLDMFNDSLSRGSLPQTLTEASITLLLKPGKDGKDCGSYRPISLLNCDAKILAKALSLRLESTIQDVISDDQTGFMPGRHLFKNVRRLFNIIYSPASAAEAEVVIALDAEKAFDRVEWRYLFACLKKFGYGPNFISWIKLLYKSPKASIISNSKRSQYFQLSRGTRQGCPLSPLLFALAIEPLSITLKTLPSISGIHRGGKEHRVSLYADDLLLYLSDPILNVPHIIYALRKFGAFSGYKLNLSKSECYPVNDLALQIQNGALPFQMSTNGFKYLGITITRDMQHLHQKNFCHLLEKTKLDLKKWRTLQLSLTGKVNCVKMTVLPKFLYLFQCIPLYIPKNFFKSLDKIFVSFLWDGRKPRIRLELLQRSKNQGGLAFPNFQYYYWASNVKNILHWLHSPSVDWCRLEAASCFSTSLRALVTSDLSLSALKYTDNPVVINTLKIWFQFRRNFDCGDLLHLSPINMTHLFPHARLDSGFILWKQQGIHLFKDMYINSVFASFDDLSIKFNLPRSSLFRYFKIRHFLQRHTPDFPYLPLCSGIEALLETPVHLRRFISRIYDQITSLKNTNLVKLRTDWVNELGEELALEDDIWNDALLRVNGSSSCAKLNLIQFKVVHRIHYSKAKLAKIYPNVEASCDRCHHTPADLTHMFWLCPSLTSYWSVIFKTLSQALKIDLEPNAAMAIFGITGGKQSILSKQNKHIIAFTTLDARRRILLHWKSNKPPKVSLWFSDLLQFMELEKIKYTLRGSRDKFLSVWGPILSYFNELKTVPE